LLPKPSCNHLFNNEIQFLGRNGAPRKVIELAAHCHIIIEVAGFKLLNDVMAEIKAGYPTIIQSIEPFLIIGIVGVMKIEHIFSNKDVFGDAFFKQVLDYITVEEHNVVVQAIVPFANKLNDAITVFVISKKQFYIEGFGTNIVPLRVKEVIINLSGEFELAVLASEKRRMLIF